MKLYTIKCTHIVKVEAEDMEEAFTEAYSMVESEDNYDMEVIKEEEIE